MRQIAKEVEKFKSGSLFANTQTNPKEKCKAITTRRGMLDIKSQQEVVVEEVNEDEKK